MIDDFKETFYLRKSVSSALTATVSSTNCAGGIVGRNMGELSSCVALNPKIANAKYFGRVYGYSTTPVIYYYIYYHSYGIINPVNNLAFDEMINPDGNTLWENIGLTLNDGGSINYGTVIGDATLCGRFKATDGWTVESGKLPGFGAAVNMPEFLISASNALACNYSLGENEPMAPLVLYEYWFDNNFAARKTFTATGNKTLSLTSVDASTCSEGVHRLYYRARNEKGDWSVVYVQAFYKAPTIVGGGVENLISGYSYWFNDEAAITVTLDKPVNPYVLDGAIPLPASLNAGATHTFFIRFRDLQNQWSAVMTKSFTMEPLSVKNTYATSVNCQLSIVNYFITFVL